MTITNVSFGMTYKDYLTIYNHKVENVEVCVGKGCYL